MHSVVELPEPGRHAPEVHMKTHCLTCWASVRQVKSQEDKCKTAAKEEAQRKVEEDKGKGETVTQVTRYSKFLPSSLLTKTQRWVMGLAICGFLIPAQK